MRMARFGSGPGLGLSSLEPFWALCNLVIMASLTVVGQGTQQLGSGLLDMCSKRVSFGRCRNRMRPVRSSYGMACVLQTENACAGTGMCISNNQCFPQELGSGQLHNRFMTSDERWVGAAAEFKDMSPRTAD